MHPNSFPTLNIYDLATIKKSLELKASATRMACIFIPCVRLEAGTLMLSISLKEKLYLFQFKIGKLL